jgi:hypothetical protein
MVTRRRWPSTIQMVGSYPLFWTRRSSDPYGNFELMSAGSNISLGHISLEGTISDYVDTFLEMLW